MTLVLLCNKLLFFLVLTSILVCGMCNTENFTVPSPQQGQCFCIGDRLTYQCTVTGGLATRWIGTMCSSNNLNLFHDEFDNSAGSVASCLANPNIRARSVSNIDNSFTSQLHINITSTHDLNGRTVECTDASLNMIGTHTIMSISSPLPSPAVLSANVSAFGELFLTWELGAAVCGDAQFTVETSCPGCTNNTVLDMTNLTCVDVPADGTACVVRIQTQTTLCGSPPSDATVVNILLRAVHNPTVRTVPRYNHTTGNLISINTMISANDSFSIIDGFVDGSVVLYEIIRRNVDLSVTNCSTTEISTSSSFCEGSSCTENFFISTSSCLPSSSVSTTVTAVNHLGPGQPSEVQDGGSNTLFNITLPQVLTLSSRDVSCMFISSSVNNTCQFFKCSPGSNCQQLSLVNEQSGIGNVIAFRLDVTQFQVNDTMEFVIRGFNPAKTIDIQGILITGSDVGTPSPPGPSSSNELSAATIAGLVLCVVVILLIAGSLLVIIILILIKKKGKSDTCGANDLSDHDKVELSEQSGQGGSNDADTVEHIHSPGGDEYAIVEKKAGSVKHEQAPETGDLYALTEKAKKKKPTEDELAAMYSVPDKKSNNLMYASLDIHGGSGEISQHLPSTEYATLVD